MISTIAALLILVPGLEHLDYSRIETVEHCADLYNIDDYTNMMTDYEFEMMESCMIEHT